MFYCLVVGMVWVKDKGRFSYFYFRLEVFRYDLKWKRRILGDIRKDFLEGRRVWGNRVEFFLICIFF